MVHVSIKLVSCLLFLTLGVLSVAQAGPPCKPDCADRECGADRCGGTCGSCVRAAPDCVDGICRAPCGTEFCCLDGAHLSIGDECTPPAPTGCIVPPKKDVYEKRGYTGSENKAYKIKRDAPQDPCTLSVDLPGANLHAEGDEDWYCFQTKLADCTFSPRFTFTHGFANEVVVRCWGKHEVVHYKTEKAAEADCREIPAMGATKGGGLSCKVPSSLTLHELKCGNRDELDETLNTAMRICLHVARKPGACATGTYSISVK